MLYNAHCRQWKNRWNPEEARTRVESGDNHRLGPELRVNQRIGPELRKSEGGSVKWPICGISANQKDLVSSQICVFLIRRTYFRTAYLRKREVRKQGDVVFSKNTRVVIPMAAWMIYCSVVRGGCCWNVIVFSTFSNLTKNKVLPVTWTRMENEQNKDIFLSVCLHLKVNLKRKFIYILTLQPKGVQTKY